MERAETVGIISDNLDRVLADHFFGSDTTDYSVPFEPSPEDQAEALGYQLAMDGQDPHAPLGMPFQAMVRFYGGFHRAQMDAAREQGRRKWPGWAEAFEFDSKSEPHPAELRGCSGHPAYEE